MFFNSPKWSVSFYATDRGSSPVEDFIESLDRDGKLKAKAMSLIRLIENYGPQVKMPYAKRLRHNLYELRIRAPLEIRIFYTFKASKVYFLHGFQKKSNKTPLKELDLAIKRLKSLT